MNIGDLFFSLRANDARLQADVKKAGDKAGTTLGQSISQSIRKSWSGGELGKGLIQGLGLAGGLGAANVVATGLNLVVDVAKDAINAASSLNETMAKSEVIFGDGADEISAWADTAAEAFGQSKRQALDTASGFAGLFDTVGIELDKAADMSKRLTVLGSDLASFFNTDVQTAIDALRSGLSGESEPLRRFNVFLSETAVNQKLVAMGQQKVNGQWTEGQKALARYTLIFEQTSDAQGDFARTSDGLANSQRQLQARWEDALARLGNALLPIVTEGVEGLVVAIEGLNDVLDILQGKIPGVDEELQGLIATLAGFIVNPFGNDRPDVGGKLAQIRVAAQDTEGVVGAAAAQVGVDAAKLRRSIGSIGDDAPGAAEKVRVSASDILTAFQQMRDVIADGGATVASALFDPILKAMEFEETQAELRVVKAQLHQTNLSEIERKALEQRRAELGKSLIEQQALLLTYGTEAEQISKTKAFLASSFWAQAYEDATPEQAAALDEWRVTLQGRLDSMEGDAGEGGRSAGQAYSGALSGQKQGITNAASTAGSGLTGIWQYYRDNAYKWGGNLGKAYADGLRATYGLVNDAANYAVKGAVGPMKPSSPPKEGALHTIDEWGYDSIGLYADSIRRGAPLAYQAALEVSRNAALGMRMAPAFAPPGVRSVPPATPSSSGQGEAGVTTGNNYEYHIHAEGQLKVPDPLAAANLLARFQGSGMLPEGGDD